MKEVQRQLPLYETLVITISLELEECSGILGERSPAVEEIDALLLKFRDMKPLLLECRRKVDIITSLCRDFKDQKLTDVERRYEELWKKRKTSLENTIEELKSAVSFTSSRLFSNY